MLDVEVGKRFVLIGLWVAASTATAQTATGYAAVTIIAPVSLISSTGIITASVSSSSGWVSLVIPRTMDSLLTVTVLPDQSQGQQGVTTSVKSQDQQGAVELDGPAAKQKLLGVQVSDGTLGPSLATSISLASLASAGFSATVAFN